MKRGWLILITVATLCLVLTSDVLARGGGRGGGGGGARMGGGGGARYGGGAYSRPSPGVGRSPSMSRPSTGAISRPQPSMRPSTGAVARPSTGVATRPGTGPVQRPGAVAGTRPAAGTGAVGRPGAGVVTRPATRPSQGQLNDFLDLPRPGTGAIGGGSVARPGAGGAAGDFLRDEGFGRPSTLPAIGAAGAIATRPGLGNRPGVENRQDRRQGFVDNRPARIEDRQQWQDNRQERRDEVRDQVNDHYPRLDFWTDYPNWAAWRITRPYRWATWASIAGWVGYGSAEPVYYDYGNTVYYQDEAVYQGGQQIATTEEYAKQATALAESAPETKPQDAEWLPLGVFALTQDGEASGSPPAVYIQLAISKEGVISGTQKHMATGKTETLEGMVDKKSQRAAWCVQGKQSPIVETGLSNLTQDTVPALLHFADGQTQQWLLVRLEEPK